MILGHEELKMEWVTPDFEEISLQCEINCYSCAEI